MATIYKIIGQSAPTTTSNVDLYTVPADTYAVISTIAVTNTSTLPAVAKIFLREAGATASTSNAFVYNSSFPGNSVTTMTLGVTLSATDIITVQSGTEDALTFHVFGSENS